MQTPQSGAPRAYLNYILLDEKSFKMVQSGAASVPQITGTMQKQLLQLNSGSDITVTHNGYLYVWVSNESKGNVYFDDIRIEHQQGPLLEENHFYPYGLKTAALSSKAFGSLLNKFQYQGDCSDFDEETGYNEFELRNYDAQRGQWTGIDPKDQYGSPYVGMGANPVNGIDPDGGEFDYLYEAATTAIGAGIGYLAAPKGQKWQGALEGAVGGAAVGYFSNDATDGIKGAWIGAGIGFATPYIAEDISGDHINGKGWLGLGGAFVGAGIGYGIGESLWPGTPGKEWTNKSPNLWANIRAFYSGLFGGTNDIPTNWMNSSNGTGFATPPKIWGHINLPNLPKLPKVSFTFIRIRITKYIMEPHGYQHHPGPDDDPDDDRDFPRKREDFSDAGFNWRMIFLIGNPVAWPALYLLDNIYIPVPHFRKR